MYFEIWTTTLLWVCCFCFHVKYSETDFLSVYKPRARVCHYNFICISDAWYLDFIHFCAFLLTFNYIFKYSSRSELAMLFELYLLSDVNSFTLWRKFNLNCFSSYILHDLCLPCAFCCPFCSRFLLSFSDFLLVECFLLFFSLKFLWSRPKSLVSI